MSAVLRPVTLADPRVPIWSAVSALTWAELTADLNTTKCSYCGGAQNPHLGGGKGCQLGDGEGRHLGGNKGGNDGGAEGGDLDSP